MKWQECVKVAFWNIKAYKRSSVKIVMGLTIVIVLLYCLISYKCVFDQQILSLKSQYKSDCYLEKYVECISWDEYEEEITNLRKQKNIIGYSEGCVLNNLINNNERNDTKRNQISSAYLCVNDQVYNGRSEILAGINPQNEFWSTDCILIGVWENDFPALPENVIEAYEENGKYYLTGRLPQNEKELLVSDYMLEQFGIAENEQERLIGSKITLYFDNKENEFFDNYILTGIFHAPVIEQRDKNSISANLQHMYLNLDTKTKRSCNISSAVIRYYVSDYEHLIKCGELARKTDNRINISLYGGIYEVLSKQISSINDILTYIIIGFVFGVTIYLICVLYFFFGQNCGFNSMLKAMGMNNKNIKMIIANELVILCFVSLMIGVYVGMFMLYGLKYIYDYALIVKLKFDCAILVQSALWAFLYSFFVCCLFGMCYFVKWKKKSLTEELSSKN